MGKTECIKLSKETEKIGEIPLKFRNAEGRRGREFFYFISRCMIAGVVSQTSRPEPGATIPDVSMYAKLDVFMAI